MNLPLIIAVAVAALGLVIFLIIRNQKDEKKFEDGLNSDYPKFHDEQRDIDTDHLTNQVH